MALPDDVLLDEVLLEIFLRIRDVAALFRCATVCKAWRDLLVSNRSFLRRCLPAEPRLSCPFAGFFTQQQRRGKCLPAPCFVPGPRPVLGPRGLLSSFVPGMGDLAVPLTSRRGLLLVRVGRLLTVCDPLTGAFKPLPPLDHHWSSPGRFTGYALLTAADCSISDEEHSNDQQMPFFKVMIIVVAQYPMHYDLYTYSSVSSDLGWTTCSATPGDQGHPIHVKLMQHNAIVTRGDAHWFVSGTSSFYFLGVCAKTGQICVRRLVNTTLHKLLNDPTYDKPYLSLDAKGRFVYLCLRTDGSRLDIRNTWKSTHIMLKSPSRHMNNLIEHTCLGEKNGMLIIKDEHQRIHVADVSTGMMQEIMDCPRGHGLSRREIVPFEMNWPALFISRLGVIAT
jgi:hypothetical protein